MTPFAKALALLPTILVIAAASPVQSQGALPSNPPDLICAQSEFIPTSPCFCYALLSGTIAVAGGESVGGACISSLDPLEWNVIAEFRFMCDAYLDRAGLLEASRLVRDLNDVIDRCAVGGPFAGTELVGCGEGAGEEEPAASPEGELDALDDSIKCPLQSL